MPLTAWKLGQHFLPLDIADVMDMYLQTSVPRNSQKYVRIGILPPRNTEFSSRSCPLLFNYTTLFTWRSGNQNINLSLYMSRRHWREGEIQVYLHWFVTSALDGGEWSTWRPGQFTRRMSHQYGGWTPQPVCTFRRRENVFPLAGMKRRILYSIAQSLYWLSYPSSVLCEPNDTNSVWRKFHVI